MITDDRLQKLISGITKRFVRRFGGDYEEYLSIAYFTAGRVLDSYDPLKGKMIPRLSYKVYYGLFEHFREHLKKETKHPRCDLPITVTEVGGFDEWCRKLLIELEGDARIVVQAVLESPQDVAGCLFGVGWSGTRVLQAFDQIRKVL